MHADDNPTISSLLRTLTLLEALVLAGAGGGLFFLPESIAALWPWPLSPFNARFLGAIYLSALAAIGLMFAAGRWSPARAVLPTIFIFTAIVLAVSLARLGRLDLHAPGAWATCGAGVPENRILRGDTSDRSTARRSASPPSQAD